MIFSFKLFYYYYKNLYLKSFIFTFLVLIIFYTCYTYRHIYKSQKSFTKEKTSVSGWVGHKIFKHYLLPEFMAHRQIMYIKLIIYTLYTYLLKFNSTYFNTYIGRYYDNTYSTYKSTSNVHTNLHYIWLTRNTLFSDRNI